MSQKDKDLLKKWQLIAVSFLADKEASPSMFEACYIALRRESPELAKKCKEEAKARMGKWRAKICQPIDED